MKKFNILLTLIMSLFFFSDVAFAKTDLTFEVYDSSFSLINENFFDFKENVLNYMKNNSDYKYYIITFQANVYKAYIFYDTTDYYFDYRINAASLFSIVQKINSHYDKIDFNSDGSVNKVSGGSSFSQTLNNSSTFYWYLYLDTNIPNMKLSSDLYNNYNVVISNKDYTLTFDENTMFPSLYEIYLQINDSHKKEKDILINFYTTMIEKISMLCNLIINNYIYLSVFVIFIFIFVIEFLRRLL